MLTEGMFLVDRYEILSKVGAGGMSDVFKAKDHILGRIVAIKVLKTEFSEDINFVTKFRTEAQSAAGLEHPNIVNIYDVGSENGLHFIVMEYVEGITLKTYIEKKGQLSFKEATSIAIQVARGIEAAHNKDITHRDIKPQNIIISTEGKVKVTDFGIARAISSNTISSDAMGSVHYASPEQARNGFIDGRSDIYSLGIVMYEMVTGRVPFDGDTTVAVAIQHLQEEMVEPSAYAPELPISYEKIVLKTTQKSPDRRYQTIGDLLVDLRKALVTPDEDFVVIAPLVVGNTRVINGEELEEIQNTASSADLNSQNGFVSVDEDDEDEDSEDATGFLDPKMEKAVTVIGIAVAALIIIIVLFLIANFFGLFNFGGGKDKDSQNTESQMTESELETEQVEMIDLVGMSVEEAEEELEALGLKINIIETESDEEDGTVLEQSVEEGAMVNKGDTITVTVAGEGEEKEVPDVVGMSLEDAEKTLTDAGFMPARDYAVSETVDKDYIISQSPNANDKAEQGTRVTIVISEGKGQVTVPANLVGKDFDTVASELEGLGFIVKKETDTTSTLDSNTVVEVSGAGKKKEIGSEIIVYVGSGSVEPSDVTYNITFDFSAQAPAGTVKYDYVLKVNGSTHESGTGVTSLSSKSWTAKNVESVSLDVTWYIETTVEGADGEEPTVTQSQQSNTYTPSYSKQ